MSDLLIFPSKLWVSSWIIEIKNIYFLEFTFLLPQNKIENKKVASGVGVGKKYKTERKY